MTSAPFLSYRVGSTCPRAHLFDLALHVPAPAPTTETGAAVATTRSLRVSLPAWIPGSYMIRDFARHLVELHAEDAAGPTPVTKIDKQSWLLPAAQGAVQLKYRVYAGDLSVRGAHLDDTHGYFNGACLFLQVHDHDHLPCRLEIERPQDPCAAAWRVATSLPSAGAPSWGYGAYQAEDYADLIDHPVEMGDFELIEFEVAGIPHAMAISGRQQADLERIARDLSRICQTQRQLFRELPSPRYLFLTQLVNNGYGGLEHRNSSSLICSREDLPQPQDRQPSEKYRRFLGLCSHEYFHLWNVKRIRPQAFVDHGLEREVHTRLLWLFEGITSYYDDLALVRSGVITPSDYLGLLANTISRVQRDPGRRRQTLAASSFDAWTKFYQQDANAPNAIVSYYAKGALAALALDLSIRDQTAGRHSLDDVMRALWQRYGRTGLGVPEQAPAALVTEVTGLDLDAFFDQAVDDTQDIELKPLFATVGVAMRLRPARDTKDLGGVCEEFAEVETAPSIGVRLQPQTTEARLSAVINDQPAERAGLSPGDLVIAVNRLRVDADSFETAVARCPIDQPIEIHAFRRDELRVFMLDAQPGPAVICDLRLQADSPPNVLEARTAWLAPDCDTATALAASAS